MTAAGDAIRQKIEEVDPSLELTRSVLADIASATDEGNVSVSDVTTILVGVVLAIETELNIIKAQLQGGEVTGGGIEVFDVNDRPWER